MHESLRVALHVSAVVEKKKAFDHCSNHKSSHDLRKVFQTIDLRVYPRGSVLSRRNPNHRRWILENFPVQLNADLSCSACASKLRNLKKKNLFSGFVKDGIGRHQTTEGKKHVAVSFSLSLRIPFAVPARLCGRIALVSGSLLDIRPHILVRKDCAHENRCAQSHLAMDPFCPEFSCGVMHLLRIARCALVPRAVGPSLKANWISAARCPGIRSLIAWNSSTRQQTLCHQYFRSFVVRLTLNLCS